MGMHYEVEHNVELGYRGLNDDFMGGVRGLLSVDLPLWD